MLQLLQGRFEVGARLIIKIVTSLAAYIGGFLAMAGNAASHTEISLPRKAFASCHRSMASGASCARVYMSFVTEFDETRDLVNTNPRHRLFCINVGLQILY